MRLLALLLSLPVIAHAQSTTYVDIPHGRNPAASSTQGFGASDDLMLCYDWVESVGITNATKLLVEIASAAGTASSATIYTASGASQVVTTGAQNWSTTGVKVVTSLTPSSFSLTAGTQYRFCWCRDGTGGTLRTADNVTTSVLSNWHNAIVTHMGSAANPCVTGVAPSSTGALSAVSMHFVWAKASLE